MYIKFVDAWLEAYKKRSGVAAVASKLNITVDKASAKANYLRKRGVNLPAMVRSKTSALNVEALNKRIEAKLS